MLDPLILHLLEAEVNTSSKLALVMLFANNPSLTMTAQQISDRLCRDPWSVETAINELLRAGIFGNDDGRISFRCSEWRPALNLLAEAYDDPYRRDDIASYIHDLERYAPYRNEMQNRRIVVMA